MESLSGDRILEEQPQDKIRYVFLENPEEHNNKTISEIAPCRFQLTTEREKSGLFSKKKIAITIDVKINPESPNFLYQHAVTTKMHGSDNKTTTGMDHKSRAGSLKSLIEDIIEHAKLPIAWKED